MKVVIPVAGRGSNLRPLTNTQPKALLPVAGKPIIGHIIDFFKEKGFKEFVLIIGYMGTRIEEFVRTHYKDNEDLTFEFVVQVPREGSAHAIWAAKESLKEETELLICLGDSIVELDFERFMKIDGCAVGVRKIDKPTDFGIAELSKDGYVKRLVEKPRIPMSNLGLVGIYKIDDAKALIEAIAYIIKNEITTNNEFHLTDALQQMLVKGSKFTAMEVNSWFDCGHKDTLLAANATLLARPNFPLSTEEECENCVLIQPVKIGKNCKISNSIIGPNVVIGDDSIIDGCVVRNSIIGTFSKLEQLILESSLVGHDSTLKGAFQSLNLGDHTDIRFGS
ncbi:sugar phosphate nucleotidyltransferase [Limibacter armeniacum]|uniref:sugar phosphate nucleotidyltransferase n=1 Tax=Limibacter armeniacum TaxID=466084 RepID=UPI002FE5D78E